MRDQPGTPAPGPGRAAAGSRPMGRGSQSPAMGQGVPGGGAQVPPSRTPGAPPRLKPISVEELVQTDVVTVESDAVVDDAVAAMAENDVGSVVVVDDDGPVGIVTDRSITLALLEYPELVQESISTLVDEELVTTTTDASVFDAIDEMKERGIRRLPVVDQQGKLEGIVTLDDIFVALVHELDVATDVIEEQSPRF